MHRATSGTADAVVIGAGIGGLAAGIRLAVRGYRVTVFDRCAQPGGRAAVYSQDGFTFDAGPTMVSASHLLEELWSVAGRRLSDDVELKPLDPFYRVLFQGGDWLDLYGRDEALLAEVRRLSPADVDGAKRLMARQAEACRVAFQQLGEKPFASMADLARLLPSLVRLQSPRSLQSLVAAHVRDPRLRAAFALHPLFIGASPARVPALYALLFHLERKWGVQYVSGGTGRLVEAMVDLFDALGGRVRLSEPVEEILVVDGVAKGVRLQGGRTVRADIVVSNVGPFATYRRLLAPVHRRTWTNRRLNRLRHSMGVFVWHFGTRVRYPHVRHHSVMIPERFDAFLGDTFERGMLSQDPFLYVTRPTATDPYRAPPGHDAFYALAPVPNMGAAIDWRTAAEPYRRVILRRLSGSLLPGFENEIVSSKIVTPLDFATTFDAEKGAAFDLEASLFQSGWFRPHNASEDVRNLFLVGAGTHPGAGIPGVLTSARILDRIVPAPASFV
ncbi:MAG: phytoene desaturase family protein [Hyphomicrobiales bacterium]